MQRSSTLVLNDLDRAVERAVVQPLLLRLLGLHLEAAADGVEGVRDEACGARERQNERSEKRERGAFFMVAVQRGCAAAFAQEGLGAAGACLPAMMAVAWAMANLDARPMTPRSFFHGLIALRVSKTPKYGPR